MPSLQTKALVVMLISGDNFRVIPICSSLLEFMSIGTKISIYTMDVQQNVKGPWIRKLFNNYWLQTQ